nr:denticleless protein [Hymenolepis microstoma]
MASATQSKPIDFEDFKFDFSGGDIEGQYAIDRPMYEWKSSSFLRVKVFKEDNRERAEREIRILRKLQECPYVYTILAYIHGSQLRKECIIHEYFSGVTWLDIIDSLKTEDIQIYAYQMFAALNACHSLNIIHSCVNYINLAINEARKQLKLTGLEHALEHSDGNLYSTNDNNIYLKSPEILLNYKKYDYTVDMWAAGCILAGSIFHKTPIFNAKEEKKQLLKIVNILGGNELIACTKKYDISVIKELKRSIRKCQGSGFESLKKRDHEEAATQEAIDLVKKLLVYDYKKRLTAKEALNHPYFSKIRERNLAKVDVTTKDSTVEELSELINRQMSVSEDDNYPDVDINRKLGRGTYGVVYYARILEALKGCPNVNRFLGSVVWDTNTFFLFFEYVNETSWHTIYDKISSEELRNYLRQMFTALDGCHSRGIMHCDVKPSNFLIDHFRKKVYLTDWGLSTFYEENAVYNTGIGSLPYLSPELLVNYPRYNYSIDIWPMGCIVAEAIFRKKFIFYGRRQDHLLEEILKVLGSECFLKFCRDYQIEISPKQMDRRYLGHRRKRWSQFITDENREVATAEAVDLVKKLLVFDPKRRLTAKQALEHDYFKGSLEPLSIQDAPCRCIPLIGVKNFECLKSQAFRLHSNIDAVSPPFDCDFSPSSPNNLLVAKEDGLVHLFDTSKEGPESLLKYYSAHENAIFSVKWVNYGRQFLTGSGDQTIKLFDAECGSCISVYLGHKMSIRSMAIWPLNKKIFASVSRDGSIRIWDLRSQNANGVGSAFHLQGCHLPVTSNPIRRSRAASRRSATDAHTITSVVFARDYELVTAGSTDGVIKIWDIRKFGPLKKNPPQPLVSLPYKGISKKQCGYSDLIVDSIRSHLFASCMDHIIYKYDLNSTSTRPVMLYTGHVTGSFYIKMSLSPDDSYLATGSADSKAYIYSVGKRTQHPCVLSGHQSGEVSVPRWCVHDPTRIVTLSDSGQLFVWQMYPAREYTMPVPGQHAGFTEYRTQPTTTEEHQKILLVPPTPKKDLPVWGSFSPVLSPINLDTSPLDATSELARRRRQMNIREFLRNITEQRPNAEGLDSTLRSARSPILATGEGPSTEILPMYRAPLVSGSRVVHCFPFGHSVNTSVSLSMPCESSDVSIASNESDSENTPSGGSSQSASGSQRQSRNSQRISNRPHLRRTTEIGHGSSNMPFQDIVNAEEQTASRKRPLEQSHEHSSESKSIDESDSENSSELANTSRDSEVIERTPRRRRRTLVPTSTHSPSLPNRRRRSTLRPVSGLGSIRNYFKPESTE